MNICIVSNFKKSGYGESTRPGQMARYLKQFGHNVLHICDWDGTENGIQHINISRDTWQPNPVKRLATFARQYWAIQTFNPDVIYVHQFNNADWAIKTKLFKGKRLVFDAHSCFYFEHISFGGNSAVSSIIKTKEQAICNKSDFIIAASAETAELLHQYYGTSKNKIKVVGNATTLQPVEKISHNNTTNFSCLTTLPQDGFPANEMALEMLLNIARTVYSKNNQIKFYVLGGGKMPEPKSPNVIYTGYVANLQQAILNATVCLMPFPEKAVCGGARNKFCDYIATGKVVITSTEGLRGMEILHSNENCIVADSVEAFANEILDLANNPDKLHKIETNVFNIRSYYNWHDRARKTETILKELL